MYSHKHIQWIQPESAGGEIVKPIKATKGNKSPGVDGIPPKLLMETIVLVSILRSRVFNFSTTVFNIKQGSGSFLLIGKKQISYNYLKRVR